MNEEKLTKKEILFAIIGGLLFAALGFILTTPYILEMFVRLFTK